MQSSQHHPGPQLQEIKSELSIEVKLPDEQIMEFKHEPKFQGRQSFELNPGPQPQCINFTAFHTRPQLQGIKSSELSCGPELQSIKSKLFCLRLHLQSINLSVFSLGPKFQSVNSIGCNPGSPLQGVNF